MQFHKRISTFAAALMASVLLVAAPAAADEREALARQFAEQTGAADLASTMLVTMAPAMRSQIQASVPELTEGELDELVGILIAEFEASEGELTDLIVALYASEFTEAELAAAIEFYQTDLGQMMLERMPVVMERAYALGQQWGTDVAQRARPRVQEYLAGLD